MINIPNDDLISRSALLNHSYCTSPCTMNNPYGGESVVSVEDIEYAPAIDPIKHGKWFEVAYFRVTRLTEVSPGVWASGTQMSETRYQCSVCKKYENVLERYDFCPNCGARMDLEE